MKYNNRTRTQRHLHSKVSSLRLLRQSRLILILSFKKMIPFAKGVRILKQDINGLIALYKPTSILSHPNEDTSNKDRNSQSIIKGVYDFNEEYYSIAALAKDEVSQSISRVWLINRLDQATSGIVLASTNQAVSDAVKDELRMRRVHKSYSALVFNQSPHASRQKLHQSFRWIDDITISKDDNHIRTQGGTTNNYVTAEANVRIKSRQPRDDVRDKNYGHNALMELDLEPLTGYSHQLRYQAAKQGYPIVGDPIYGDFRGNKNFKANFQSHPMNYLLPEQLEDPSFGNAERDKLTPAGRFAKPPPQRNYFNRLFLHARKTELSYALNGERFAFSVECPLPRVFDVAYRGVRQQR